MHPMLTKVLDTIRHLKAGGVPNGQIAALVSTVINSPLLATAVAATPTPVDDVILGALKILFPAPSAPAATA